MDKDKELRKQIQKEAELRNKQLRKERVERFEVEYLPQLKVKGCNITINKAEGKYTIDTDVTTLKLGKIDFFPKSDIVYIHLKRRWIKKEGLDWIKENLIKS